MDKPLMARYQNGCLTVGSPHGTEFRETEFTTTINIQAASVRRRGFVRRFHFTLFGL